MPKSAPIITSFVGGEFSPSLFGRIDVNQYANACQTLENCLVRPYGSAINTPGTIYLNGVKTPSKKTRLLSFVFNRSDTYIIEMGEAYFRFYTTQAQVVKTTADTDSWLQTTSYVLGSFVKTNSILYYAIVGNTSGTDFATDSSLYWTQQSIYEVPHSYSASELSNVHYAQINDVIHLAHKDHAPAKLSRISSNDWTLADTDFIGGPFLDDNSTATTLTVSPTSGTVNISASTVLFKPLHVGSIWSIGGLLTVDGSSSQGYVKITAFLNSQSVTATVLQTLDVPTPQTLWAEGAWSDVRGYPATLTFHERRLWYARTDTEPQRLWSSKTFDYVNFSKGTDDDDAIIAELATDEATEIKWLASGNSLAAGTFSGEFVLASGTSGEALTPSNVNATRQTSWGSRNIQPKRMGNYIYYIQRFGEKVRELYYYWDLDNYKSVDKTIFSDHITGDGIIDMAYQQSPDNILWCVTTGGEMATMTREIDQEMTAWTRQKAGSPTSGISCFESVAVVPHDSQNYDEVYTIIQRTIDGSTTRYIERFVDPIPPARQDNNVYLQSSLGYSAYDQTTTETASISMLATGGDSVLFTSSIAHFASTDVGKRIRAIDQTGLSILGEAKIIGYTSSTIVVGNVVKVFDATSYIAGRWGTSVDTVSGLSHLENEMVAVLADGGIDKPNKLVTSSTISLAYNYFVAKVGLPYTSTLFTMPLEGGSATGTSQGKLGRLYQVGLRVNKTTKGLLIGGDANNLDQVAFRDPSTLMGQPESLFTGIAPNIDLRSDVDYDRQVMIKNELPLPMEILSIFPLSDIYDK